MAGTATVDPMLALPLKKPDSVDWVKPLKNYIAQTLSKQEADGFAECLERMNRLRKTVKDAADGKEKLSEHVLENGFFPYCTLLQHASSHFPLTEGKVKISFTWHDAGNARKKTSLPNVHLEIASVIFDAAMIYVSLAANEDRSTPEGVKTAFKHYQTGAGLLDFVRERLSLVTDKLTTDLSSDGLAMFSNFTLASAHHCSFLKAEKEMKGKFQILSKLAMEGSLMYENLRRQMVHPSVEDTVDKSWAKYAELYRLVFEARANVHLADELHASLEIGQEIARLNRAQELLTEAQGQARTLAAPYQQFLQTLTSEIARKLGSAVNENEKIYHHRVPKDPVAVPPSFGKTLAKPTPFPGLSEISRERDPFTQITPVHILEAKNGFKDEITQRVNQHCAEARGHRARVKDAIQQLGVVGALSAFDPSQTGLPASLHQRIAKLREGAAAFGGCCQQLMDRHAALVSLAKSVHDMNSRLLDELNEEAKNDRILREKFGRKWTRESSEVVNKDLVAALKEFRMKLEQATTGDRTIEERIKNHFDGISKLDLPPPRLDALLPDRTVTPGAQSGPVGAIVQDLQRCLSAMDEKEAVEQVLLSEIRDMLEQDEKDLGLQLAAAGPGAECEVLAARRQKYEEKMQFSIQIMIDSDNLLSTITQTLKALNDMRQMDGSTNQREQVINRLELACNKFEELSANLREGLNFYTTMSEATERQKNKVEDFVFARGVQKEDLMTSIQREAAQIENAQELLAAVRQLELESEKAKMLELQHREEQGKRQQWQQFQQLQSPQPPQPQPQQSQQQWYQHYQPQQQQAPQPGTFGWQQQAQQQQPAAWQPQQQQAHQQPAAWQQQPQPQQQWQPQQSQQPQPQPQQQPQWQGFVQPYPQQAHPQQPQWR